MMQDQKKAAVHERSWRRCMIHRSYNSEFKKKVQVVEDMLWNESAPDVD